jgi:hypothetical protein
MPKIVAKTLSDMLLKKEDKFSCVIADEIKKILRPCIEGGVVSMCPTMNIAGRIGELGSTSIIKPLFAAKCKN